MAPLSGGAAGAGAASQPQTLFQIQPKPASGVTEYTIEIDGQQLRCNTPPRPLTSSGPTRRRRARHAHHRTAPTAAWSRSSTNRAASAWNMIATAQRTSNTDGNFNMS